MTSACGRYPLSRDHYIPLRRQLAADLEAGIRDERVRPGAPLPSSRDLARRLGVDRGTVGAALARLRERNLIELVSGRRPRAAIRPHPEWIVPPRKAAPKNSDAGPARPTARAAALMLLRGAHARGLSRWELLEELEKIVAGPMNADPFCVTLCEPRTGLRAVLAAELEAKCRIAIRAVDSARATLADSPMVVRHELLPRIRRTGTIECVPIALAGGTRERDFVRRQVRRGMVLLLSRSETVRDFATELAARDFDRGISFRALDPGRDRHATRRAVAAAAIVFHDRLTAMPRGMPASAPGIPITLVPPREIERLRGYLSRADGAGRDGVGVAPQRQGP